MEPSSSDPRVFELETQAQELFNAKKYAECRALLEEAMALRMSTKRRLYFMKNVIVTYDIEGDRTSALRVAKEGLELIERDDLGHKSDEAAVLRGWFGGTVAHYKGQWWPSFFAFGPTLAAPGIGAAIGAFVAVSYGFGAVKATTIGAILGYFFLMRLLARSQRTALCLSVMGWGATFYLLSALGPKTLGITFAVLVGLAALLGLYVLAVSRGVRNQK